MIKERISSILIVFVLLAAFLARIPLMSQAGKDYVTFQQSVNDLAFGINPYKDTLRSFQDKDITSGGYAYFPGLLYTFFSLYLVSIISYIPVEILWKIPNLLAEFGVAFLLIKSLRPKGIGTTLVALVIWLFNPYFVLDQRYTYTDAIPVFFMIASMFYLGKDDVVAGALFALAVIFKPFPLFAFPLFLLLSSKKLNFIVSGVLVGLLFSIPFLRSFEDFMTYVRGALFVHEGRSVTGRPFLFYISYFYKIEFIQLIPIKIYTTLATFLGWVLIIAMYFFKRIKNPYILATAALVSFYAFSPVLNRTYLLWFIPFFLISLASFKKHVFFYTIAILFYAFYSWYLWQWIDGFHITRPW
ncbi:hypothetical protein GYA27_01845 [candidate division WWE3 bacterium]|uniref:DUF2029 domain-containing protein n=1 Tax=candidate division WWE3 bacterium TaxID=2053526 RepID=A0A7X9HGI0_UNCKA|nr:hypothetical protein [candidate division WWE3 bacterium]